MQLDVEYLTLEAQLATGEVNIWWFSMKICLIKLLLFLDSIIFGAFFYLTGHPVIQRLLTMDWRLLTWILTMGELREKCKNQFYAKIQSEKTKHEWSISLSFTTTKNQFLRQCTLTSMKLDVKGGPVYMLPEEMEYYCSTDRDHKYEWKTDVQLHTILRDYAHQINLPIIGPLF